MYRVPRGHGSKLFWLFHLVGVGCFGRVSYSTSPELTVLVAFRILPRRVVLANWRDESIMLTPIRKTPSPADVTPIILRK